MRAWLLHIPTRRRIGLLALTAFALILTACGTSGSTTFRSVHAGERHTCAIDDEGNAWCWGANRFGQLGDGSNTGRSRPVKVGGGHSFTTLDLGSTHTCGIDVSGAVWCWGGNFVGKLGDGTTASSAAPVRVTGLPGSADVISATSDRSCAIVGDSLWCWGDNTQNVMGIDRRGALLTATEILPANVVSHAMSPGKACTAAEKVLCVGIDVDGVHPVDGFYGTTIDGLPDEPIVEVTAAQFIFCGRTAEGRVFCWGNLSWFIDQDGTWQEGVWFEPSELVGARASKLTTMEATVCLLEDGRVVCRGELPGRGWVLSGGVGVPMVDAKKLGEPWVIPFPGTEVVDVSGGSAHICAVVDGGEIWCSGSNSDGQLGNTGGDSLEPVRVAG